jgi:hypothetical protein
MAAELITLPFRPVINTRGVLEPGALLDVFQAGTTTRINVFSDSDLSAALSNPVVANSSGVFPSVYWDNVQAVRVRVREADGTVLGDADPYLSDLALNTLSVNTSINWLPSSTGDGTAARGFIDTSPANHVGEAWTALNVETVAPGSEGNGPTSADYAGVFSIQKDDYASGSADSGEIDALTIFVRQDGPDGLPSGSSDSSDAAGILMNVQNIGTCGFLVAWEALSSNINRGTFALDFAIRTQIGVLDMNGVGALKFGYGAIADAGVITDAFYAGTNGGSFTNILRANNALTIAANGDYSTPNSFWSGGAWLITRSAPQNGTTEFRHRGTGSLFFNTPEGNIVFGTNNVVRTVIDTDGTLRPAANNSFQLGSFNHRWLQGCFQELELNNDAGVLGVIIRTGSGSPEGAITAKPGSLWLRQDGGAGTSFYVKESGTGNTGWAAK